MKLNRNMGLLPCLNPSIKISSNVVIDGKLFNWNYGVPNKCLKMFQSKTSKIIYGI